MHLPVLVSQLLEHFERREIRFFFDGTLGAGGHARAILEAHPEIDRYLGCDRDPDALDLAKKTLKEWKEKVKFFHGSYTHCREWLKKEKVGCLDGFMIDAGVSSMQLDTKERGFSFQGSGPLDMRMDPTQTVTAEQIVNRASEIELARILHEYGEERRSRSIAKAIVNARKKKRIRTTEDLVSVILPVAHHKKRLHPATLTFQALRIAVNDELTQLKAGIEEGIQLLCPGGRIAVISFHRLEDRIAKNSLRTAAKEELISLMTKKPLEPTRSEVRANPRCRSAKLRIGERI